MALLPFVEHRVPAPVPRVVLQQAHGQPGVTAVQYMGTSRFWFESMQNWQSEFISLLAMVVLSIFLRGKGSAESKPVAAPHWGHGEDEPRLVPVPVDDRRAPVPHPA